MRSRIIFEITLGIILIGLGVFILFLSYENFALAPWQRYGMGGFTLLYGILKLVLARQLSQKNQD